MTESRFKPILALGPNPAWQQTLFFKVLRPGAVNRAYDMHSFASGKGINFCRAARNWGNPRTELLQFAGGDTGRRLCRCLDEEGVIHRTVKVKPPTRTCYTCLDLECQSMTELIEPSFPISAAAAQQFHKWLRQNVDRFDGVALCGTLPTGSAIEIYRRAAEIVRDAQLPLLVDSWQNIAPVLEVGGELILKVNTAEIKTVAVAENAVGAMRILLNRYGLKAVAVTDGPGKAYLMRDGKLFTYELAVLDKIVSSLGCGDTNASVFFNEYLAGTATEEAFLLGLAAASANCLSATCGDFNRKTAMELYAKIKMNVSNWNKQERKNGTGNRQ
ncbi:MAG: PfkB family carbohydrate kinase [Victivallaceae bacterium]|nr:PfkB family carbohydrate kinase [Victivallaceae bacterium]